MNKENFDEAIRNIDIARRRLQYAEDKWYYDRLSEARDIILTYVEELSPKYIKLMKTKVIKRFICSLSLFSAFVLFSVLLTMLTYGFTLTYTLTLLNVPIAIAYVIFLLCFIGFYLL